MNARTGPAATEPENPGSGHPPAARLRSAARMTVVAAPHHAFVVSASAPADRRARCLLTTARTEVA